MTTPTSRLSYQAHFDIFEQAMNDPKGIRIRQENYGQAYRLRLEFHHARVIDRRDNAMAYEPGHKLHGCSIYDQLLCTIERDDANQTWLYIHKRDASAFHIESLSDGVVNEEIETLEEAVQDFTAPVAALEEATEDERRF